MYLRHCKRKTKEGEHTYWTLVKSVRRGSRVRQEVVAHLGRLDEAGIEQASSLARHFLGPRANQGELFEDRRELKPAHVDLSKVRVERPRAFGDVWLGLLLWRALGLEDFCRRHLPQGEERVPWADIASILVLARLCEPSSELHIAEDWYRKTALEDLIGVPSDPVHHTRLYQGLDRLLVHKDALQSHLKGRFGDLFALDYDLVLYDVTSTYFEGQATGNPMAKHGHSRDSRPDCTQVCIGLVVMRDGYPLGWEILDGNRVDVTTVEAIVFKMEQLYGHASRVWVMDRGMASEANLEWLRAGGRRYLIGTPRAEMKKWAKELTEREGWNEVREGLEVKTCQGPDGPEVFLLCRSVDRRAKEEAIHARFTKQMREDLASVGRRLKRARKGVDRDETQRQIGRILERNSRVAKKFDVQLRHDPTRASQLRLTWTERRDWKQWAELTEGTYILRTNVTDWTGPELWQTYVQLNHAEAAFRIQKSDLSIRPVWHQKAERVNAHILVCFLAYALWKLLEGWQCRAGLGNSPKSILEELKRLQCVDVVLPTVEGDELRLRCVLEPEPALVVLLEKLGLRLPKRLKAPVRCEM
jgi:transposase